jgi:hypothetical protein
MSAASDPTPAAVEQLGDTHKVASRLLMLADGNFRGYSAHYDRIARCWADDEMALAATVGIARPRDVSIKVLAAIHLITLLEPELTLARIYGGAPGDPWPPFRELLLTRRGEVADIVAEHSIQTNEVGRSALLVPAVTWARHALDTDQPLALVEIGPSAGLNLLFDRYHVVYSDGRECGDPSSPVRLQCELNGAVPPPLPDPPLTIARRLGIDLSPIDAADPDATRWLEACLWPDVPDRLERLRAALSLARHDPPELRTGDAVELLGPVLDGLPADCLPVVFSTWAIAYLSADDRQEIHDLVAERAANRDLALITAEYPHVMPWIPPARPPAVDDGVDATLIGASVWRNGVEQAQPIGWTHAHGQWLDWIAPGPPSDGAT